VGASKHQHVADPGFGFEFLKIENQRAHRSFTAKNAKNAKNIASVIAFLTHRTIAAFPQRQNEKSKRPLPPLSVCDGFFNGVFAMGFAVVAFFAFQATADVS
jgi:hypothetical protein